MKTLLIPILVGVNLGNKFICEEKTDASLSVKSLLENTFHVEDAQSLLYQYTSIGVNKGEILLDDQRRIKVIRYEKSKRHAVEDFKWQASFLKARYKKPNYPYLLFCYEDAQHAFIIYVDLQVYKILDAFLSDLRQNSLRKKFYINLVKKVNKYKEAGLIPLKWNMRTLRIQNKKSYRPIMPTMDEFCTFEHDCTIAHGLLVLNFITNEEKLDIIDRIMDNDVYFSIIKAKPYMSEMVKVNIIKDVDEVNGMNDNFSKIIGKYVKKFNNGEPNIFPSSDQILLNINNID